VKTGWRCILTEGLDNTISVSRLGHFEPFVTTPREDEKMKKLIFILFVSFALSLSVKGALAGDYFIDEVRCDKGCVKVVYGSTEDDSTDNGLITVTIKRQKRNGEWFIHKKVTANIGGVSGGNHYKEFCGLQCNRGHGKISVKIYHNRQQEDVEYVDF